MRRLTYWLLSPSVWIVSALFALIGLKILFFQPDVIEMDASHHAIVQEVPLWFRAVGVLLVMLGLAIVWYHRRLKGGWRG